MHTHSVKRYAYSPWEKYPEEKFLCRSLFLRLFISFCFTLWMTIWAFFPTFFSASAIFSSLSVLPSFHFHSLSLFSGSKWKEGHLSIISLWTYGHISHCNRHHKKPSTSANPQDWLLASAPSRQVLEFSKECCPAEHADNLSSRVLTSIHVALRQYRFCQSRVPFWKGQESSLGFLSWLLSGLCLSLLGNWTKLQ